MEAYREQFSKYLAAEDKSACVKYALDLLEQCMLDVVGLYEGVLAPALNTMSCNLAEKGLCIWQEHVRSAIVRTVLECCYPYVLAARQQLAPAGEKVMIVCPAEEYHEIGARMAVDFFTLCGYDAVFVGANVPREEFGGAIAYTKPQYIALSITNYYNLFITAKTIAHIRQVDAGIKILVGGSAFFHQPELFKKVGADGLIRTWQDVEKLAKGGL